MGILRKAGLALSIWLLLATASPAQSVRAAQGETVRLRPDPVGCHLFPRRPVRPSNP